MCDPEKSFALWRSHDQAPQTPPRPRPTRQDHDRHRQRRANGMEFSEATPVSRPTLCDRASPLHGLAWLAAQEQHDQPGGVTRDTRKPAMGGRHASCDIGPRRHNRVSLMLPDFGRSRAKSGVVLQRQCQSLHPLSLSAPSMITYSCVHPVGFWATKQTASIHRRTIGHLGSVGFIQMLRVDTGMWR